MHKKYEGVEDPVDRHPPSARERHFEGLPCQICNQVVRIEDARTDENGNAIHESCYLQRLKREDAGEREAK